IDKVPSDRQGRRDTNICKILTPIHYIHPVDYSKTCSLTKNRPTLKSILFQNNILKRTYATSGNLDYNLRSYS
ncbi:hypothetical protein L9F63_000103, partial [Diploptera punctata]